MSMNSCVFLGNLTRTPEVRFIGDSEVAVCNFGIAVNERYTKRDGEEVEKTLFLDCEAWNKMGEVIAEYFVRGQQILVQGKLQLDSWENDEGEKRSKHKLNVQSFNFTGTKAENDKLREERDDEDFDEENEADIPF